VASHWNYRAVLHCKLARFEQSLADYTKSLELEPADAETYNERGGLLGELQRFQEVLTDSL
jgi:tetratricopeptide (TPR) repeat protein